LPGENGAFSRGSLPDPRLQNATHDAVVNLRGLDASTPHSFSHNERAQLWGGIRL